MRRMLILLTMGWMLWQGSAFDSRWRPVQSFAEWEACDRAGAALREGLGMGVLMPRFVIWRPAPYACVRQGSA